MQPLPTNTMCLNLKYAIPLASQIGHFLHKLQSIYLVDDAILLALLTHEGVLLG